MKKELVMMHRRFLRWLCDARQLAALKRFTQAYRALKQCRKEINRLFDDLLGDGPNGPISWTELQFMLPAYQREVIPIKTRATAARHALGNTIRECRSLGIPRWQIRLAV